MRIALSTSLVCAVIGSTAFAQEVAAPAAAPAPEAKPTLNNKPLPESAVLPANVARFRLVYGYAWGDKGWDKDGEEIDSPVKVTASGGAAVFEYGLTEDLSLQVLVPYSFGKELTLNDDYFNKEFNKGYAAAANAVYDSTFEAQTTMTPAALPDTVGAQLEAGLATAAGVTTAQLAAMTGAQLATALNTAYPTLITTKTALNFSELAALMSANPATAAAGAQLAALATALEPAALTGNVTAANISDVWTAAIAANRTAALADGKAAAKKTQKKAAEKAVEDTEVQTGLGDVEIGAKYTYSSPANPLIEGVPVYASVAGGIRLNSSGYADAMKDGKIPVGRGTTDGAIRLNFDYLPINGVALSVENQTEMMLMKGETYVADEKVDYERVGMRQLGYGKIVVDPSAWVEDMHFISLTEKYNWDYDAQTKTDGEEDMKSDETSQTQSLTTSVGLSGFGYQVPVQLDIDYTMPLSGKYADLVTSSVVGTLKLFYKF